jgi:hypothetical protein
LLSFTVERALDGRTDSVVVEVGVGDNDVSQDDVREWRMMAELDAGEVGSANSVVTFICDLFYV